MQGTAAIRCKLTFEGYPISFLNMLAITLVLSLAIPEIRIMTALIGSPLAIAYLFWTRQQYPVQLSFGSGCEFGIGECWGVAVSGISQSFCDDIQEHVNDGLTLIIGCPDHPSCNHLRMVIAEHIQSQGGCVNFEDSQTFYLYILR